MVRQVEQAISFPFELLQVSTDLKHIAPTFGNYLPPKCFLFHG